MPLAPDVEVSVARYLADSHAAHLEYRRASVKQDKLAVHAALVKASQLRIYALNSDPTRQAQAWQDEAAQFPHDELTAFYHRVLSR